MKTQIYIDFLSFLGSLLAGGFFLLCLLVLGLLNNKEVDLYLGLFLMILVSVLSLVLRVTKKETFGPVIFSFLNQGFGLFLFGFKDVFKLEGTTFLWTILFFQFGFFFLVSNPIQRFLSPILFFLFSGVLLLEYQLLYFFPLLTTVCLLLLIYFIRAKHKLTLFHNLSNSLGISLLILVGFSFFPEFKKTPFITETLSIIFFFVGSFLLYRELFQKIKISILLLILFLFGLVFFPTLETPGIIVSFFLILLCSPRVDPFLYFLAWISLVLFYFGFYYDLDTNLLEKAKLMLGSSLLFFLTYFILRWAPRDKTPNT